MEAETKTRQINEIAAEIITTWTPVHAWARPYVQAMMQLTTVYSFYGHDSAAYVVNGFLANAGTWKGENARRIKLELNKMVK